MKKMTLKQFSDTAKVNGFEFRQPFNVCGVWVVALNLNTFARCDYVNPNNQSDFLHGVELTAKQMRNAIASDIESIGAVHIY